MASGWSWDFKTRKREEPGSLEIPGNKINPEILEHKRQEQYSDTK